MPYEVINVTPFPLQDYRSSFFVYYASFVGTLRQRVFAVR
jgi:hypothetical protein